MIDEPRARELARAAFDEDVVLGAARELNEGWFFPSIAKRVDVFAGVIVNKGTGRTLQVVVDSPHETDPTLYDRGFQHSLYDLVVLTVEDLDQTVRTMLTMNAMTTDVYYRHDRVYRVNRGLTEAEVRDRLSSLPAVFSGSLNWVLADFENAKEQGWFTFRTFEYRGKE